MTTYNAGDLKALLKDVPDDANVYILNSCDPVMGKQQLSGAAIENHYVGTETHNYTGLEGTYTKAKYNISLVLFYACVYDLSQNNGASIQIQKDALPQSLPSLDEGEGGIVEL